VRARLREPRQHIQIVRNYGLPAVVAINTFPTTSRPRSRSCGAGPRRWRKRRGRQPITSPAAAPAPRSSPDRSGEQPRTGRPTSASCRARRAARGTHRRASPRASTARTGSTCRPGRPSRSASSSASATALPVCMAKTALSLSHDPAAQGSADWLPRAYPRCPSVRGRRLRDRLLRRHADDARFAVTPLGRGGRHQRGRRKRRPVLRLS
jgi:hypothetical protein